VKRSYPEGNRVPVDHYQRQTLTQLSDSGSWVWLGKVAGSSDKVPIVFTPT